MKCTDVGEQLMDVAAGLPAPPPVEEHLRTCRECSERLQSLQGTLALLDEWQAPEPSPYFDSRLEVRLREEAARPQGWWAWLKKPALAGATAALLIIGGLMVGNSPSKITPAPQPGSAVADLQNLDKNHDLLANFDLLDDAPVDQSAQIAEP